MLVTCPVYQLVHSEGVLPMWAALHIVIDVLKYGPSHSLNVFAALLGPAEPWQATISLRDVREKGRGDLLQAIHSHGGPAEVSKRLGMACTT